MDFVVMCLSLVTIFSNFGEYMLSSALLDELKSINYEVDIIKTPVRMAEEPSSPSLQIRSKYGQTYQCSLPEIEDNESFDKKEDNVIENIDVKELLKPIQMGSCLLKTKDWWTYEFCYGHYVKQYHIEDGKIIGQVITLGLYESDYDWNNETEEEKYHHVRQRYHSQTYSNGSRCDLTGLPRNAEVRFFCEEDAGDYIYRVDEPGTCSYVLTVHTSRLCSHPRLRPLPSTKAHVISCSPLLNDEEYSLYMRKVEEERLLAEEKRNKWLIDQQERLKLMKTFSKEIVGTNEDEFPSTKFVMSSEYDSDDDMINTISSEDNMFEEIDKLNAIPSDRLATVRNDLEKHIDSLISEAEEEIDTSLKEESKDTIYIKLASTLTTLLERLDKAEKDATKVAQQFQQNTIADMENKADEAIVSDTTDEEEDESEEEPSILGNFNSEYQTQTGKLRFNDNEHAQTAVLDDEKLHVRIRRLDRKSPDAAGDLHEMDFAQRTKLEQAIKERLEESGVDTGGRRIEVKIITAGYYDNEDGKDFHTLSDDETVQFQNMIMALLTGQQEAVQEMERHKKLEENYKFVWDSNELIPLEEEE